MQETARTHLEKIMTIAGSCEMKHEISKEVFLFLTGRILQPILKGQNVVITDAAAKPVCNTYIAGITVGSDQYSKVHKEAAKGEEVQLVVGTNYKRCPQLKEHAKYLCAVVYDD